MIPKHIIQTGTQEQQALCHGYIKSLRDVNRDFLFRTFDNAAMDKFVERGPASWYKAYCKLPHLIQRVDLFRYIAVYEYGGVYFDLDVEGLQPLDAEVLTHECVFPLDTFVPSSHEPLSRYGYFGDNGQRFLVGQYAFAAVKEHPFILKLITGIVDNIDAICAADDKSHLYVYQTTGPDYVTRQWMDGYRDTVHILTGVGVQKFGRYAQHRYMGSWK